jgi:hypothetical protein
MRAGEGGLGDRRGVRVAAWATAWTLLARASVATAQLRDEAERVADSWRASGANALLLKTRFLNEERADVALPELPQAACTTLAFLGARGLSFRVALVDADNDGSRARISSEAGALSTERCGQPSWLRAVVVLESGRGALEVVVGRSAAPLPALRSILPERMEGYLGPQPEPGRLAPLPSPERRAAAEEVRARRDGAEVDRRLTWIAGTEGGGTAQVILEAGCHALVLFAPESTSSQPRVTDGLDLDAEMRDVTDDHLMARDQTDAPDARVAACVGETTRVSINFVGGTPGARVLVTHEFRRLPERVPTVWGSAVRARMAQTLLARHVVSLPNAASALAEGGLGSAALPLSVEPGACYLAVGTLAEQANGGIGLSVRVAGRESVDARTSDGVGSAVAFCAGTNRRALAYVDARGAQPFGWAFAVFRLQSGIWDSSW